MSMEIKFNINPPGDVRGENSVMNNFRAESLTELEIFIREFLQNVLDNRIDSKVEARVNIQLKKIEDQKSLQFIDDIFKPAIPFITAAQSTKFIKNDRTEALVLEEFETKGITGVTNNSDADGNWSKFWHHQAKSNKSGGLNGRAGQGKISYNMMSNVWTIFGLTRTIEEPHKNYLIGKCILPDTFNHDGKPYKSQAFISDYEKVEYGIQPVPYEDENLINKFCNAFLISRQANQIGTTWVIPFPKKNPKDDLVSKNDQIIQAVIKGYYYSILKRKLSVRIGNINIDKDSIIELARSQLGKSETSFYAFIKEIFDQNTSLIYETILFSPKWTSFDYLPEDFLDAKKSSQLKKTFQSGQIAAIKLPITLHPKGSKKINSFITVFIKSDKAIMNTTEAFIRTDLEISDEKKITKLPGNVYALVVADHPEIASFLADCEIANHTKFDGSMQSAKENYSQVPETLAVVRKGIRLVYQYLSHRQAQRIENLLNKFISIKASKGLLTKKTIKDEEAKKEDEVKNIDETTMISEVDDEIETDTKFFKIISKKGGFRIQPGSSKFSKEDLPARIKIQTGYETIDHEGIKAFLNHHPFDYNFKDPNSLITIQLDNLSRVKDSDTPNELQLDIEGVDFSAEISGFKHNSRLRVRVVIY